MEEHEQDTAGVAGPPPVIVATPLLVGLGLHRLRPLRLLPKAIAKPAGVLMLIAGIAGMAWSVVAFRRHETPIEPHKPAENLITSGPFQYTRNPAYASQIALYLGITKLANSLWPLLLLPAALFALKRGVIEREERYLERKFGEEYRQYCERVGRWV